MTKFMNPRFSVPIDNPNYEEIFKKSLYRAMWCRDKYYISKDGELDLEKSFNSKEEAEQAIRNIQCGRDGL
jgi:hypothetical protein